MPDRIPAKPLDTFPTPCPTANAPAAQAAAQCAFLRVFTAQWRLVAVVIAVAALAMWHRSGATDGTSSTAPRPVVRSRSASTPSVAVRATAFAGTLEAEIEAFCGACHPTPRPESFTKAEWPKEVKRGFIFYEESERKGLTPPDVEQTIEYFRSRAPTEIDVPAQVEESSPAVRFTRADSTRSLFAPPAVSCLKWVTLVGGESRLVVSDMQSGAIQLADPRHLDASPRTIAMLAHPAMVSAVDADGDGSIELVAAELGSLFSGDHHRGAVYHLIPPRGEMSVAAGGQLWDQRLLASGLGRVADVTPMDVDGDGRREVIVAEFGHVRTGSISLLRLPGEGSRETSATASGADSARLQVLDERAGTISTPIADFNGDGRADFVALVSQEHESVDLFTNLGEGQFERRELYRLPDPSYGSSGIQVVDLDGDGDVDVLFSNGDTFGSHHLKSFHAIHWLENGGAGEFKHRVITKMIGVQRVATADLDGDGDQDIVGVGFLPQNLVDRPGLDKYDSVLWLEQTLPGVFTRHSIERGRFIHAALEVADFDGDGDFDIAVGNFVLTRDDREPWFSIFWNAGQ